LSEPIVLQIDLDNTLVDFVTGWQKVWNARYPDRIITQPPTTYNLEEAYSNFGTEKEIMEIWREPNFFLHLEPLPGALEAFKQMAKIGLDLYICSTPASANTSLSEKADWVELHLGKEWVKRLILTRDKTLIRGDYLIDDNPFVVGNFQPEWEHVILDASYNKEDDVKDSDKHFRITWDTWPSLLLYHST
jgi:5'-nucleotidase